MKKASLFVLLVASLGLSSCCCQGTNPPKLRPMPKDILEPATVNQGPILVAPTKNAK
ncbi:MAG: hypothetical protein R3Y56_01555 [Akkermansia sp.]